MKRVFFIVIGGFILLSIGAVLIFSEDKDDMIDIISVKKDYARVLTQEEVIDIPLYITSDQSFLTHTANISASRIISDGDEVSIDIVAINDMHQLVTYEDISYFLFHIVIDFSQVYNKNLRLSMPNAQLQISYNNDEVLSLALGHMGILFHDLEQTTHIDFNRLYATYDHGAISSIILDLENKTGQTIEISYIETLNPSLHLNLNYALIHYDRHSHIDQLSAFIEDYQMLIDKGEIQGQIDFYQDTQYILPLKHIKHISYLNRFPLIIHYRYHEQDYTYIIDDYMFFQPISDLYEDYYELEHNQYQYS